MVNNGNLIYAVVTITDIKCKKLDTKKVTFDQNGCEYHPHGCLSSGNYGRNCQSGRDSSQRSFL